MVRLEAGLAVIDLFWVAAGCGGQHGYPVYLVE
jgi:hypothetical protein